MTRAAPARDGQGEREDDEQPGRHSPRAPTGQPTVAAPEATSASPAE